MGQSMSRKAFKKLYLAKDIFALREKAVLDRRFIDDLNTNCLCSLAQRLLWDAERSYHSGDEEMAYVYFLKYLAVVLILRARRDFDANPRAQALSNSANSVLEKATCLKESLARRYRRPNEPDDAEENKKSSSIGNINRINVAREDTSGNVVEIDPPVLNEIFPTNVLDLMKNAESKFIIIDVRASVDFEVSHIKHGNCINIPVVPGVSSSLLEGKLMQSSLCSVDYVILIDWDSPNASFESNHPLYIVASAMQTKNIPLIACGGFRSFQQQFPSYTTGAPFASSAEEPENDLPSVGSQAEVAAGNDETEFVPNIKGNRSWASQSFSSADTKRQGPTERNRLSRSMSFCETSEQTKLPSGTVELPTPRINLKVGETLYSFPLNKESPMNVCSPDLSPAPAEAIHSLNIVGNECADERVPEGEHQNKRSCEPKKAQESCGTYEHVSESHVKVENDGRSLSGSSTLQENEVSKLQRQNQCEAEAKESAEIEKQKEILMVNLKSIEKTCQVQEAERRAQGEEKSVIKKKAITEKAKKIQEEAKSELDMLKTQNHQQIVDKSLGQLKDLMGNGTEQILHHRNIRKPCNQSEEMQNEKENEKDSAGEHYKVREEERPPASWKNKNMALKMEEETQVKYAAYTSTFLNAEESHMKSDLSDSSVPREKLDTDRVNGLYHYSRFSEPIMGLMRKTFYSVGSVFGESKFANAFNSWPYSSYRGFSTDAHDSRKLNVDSFLDDVLWEGLRKRKHNTTLKSNSSCTYKGITAACDADLSEIRQELSSKFASVGFRNGREAAVLAEFDDLKEVLLRSIAQFEKKSEENEVRYYAVQKEMQWKKLTFQVSIFIAVVCMFAFLYCACASIFK